MTLIRQDSEPNFVRSIDVTAADFDGTDTANVADALKTKEQNGSRFNAWKQNGGFLYMPTTDGVIDVLTWEDYRRNGKVVDDTLKQSVTSIGGGWQKTRVVKIYSTSTVKTMNIGIVL